MSSSSSSLDLRSSLPDGWRETRMKLSRPTKKERRVIYINYVPKTAPDRERPRKRYGCGSLGYLFDERAKEISEKALLSYNQTNSPEYELVKPLHCMFCRYQRTYHCNFIARMKMDGRDDDHDNREMLFFTEMKIIDDEPLRCVVCCIIGPRFTRTGERGCWSCKNRQGLIQHPQHMTYTKPSLQMTYTKPSSEVCQ